jgi:hypothetical protein
VLVAERNFAEFSSETAHDYFEKRHEPSLRVGRHGEATLEGSGAVSSADPGAEDKGVATVEGDGWLDEDGSCDNPPRKILYYRLRPIHFGH